MIENLLPNVQGQLWSGGGMAGLLTTVKATADGTGYQTQAICSGFTPSSANPVLACSNTQQIRPGDIVIPSIEAFWGFGGRYLDCSHVNCVSLGGGRVTGSRVTSVVPNVSITLASPGFGGVSPPVSTAISVLPICPGDLTGCTANAFDGWTKTLSLAVTVDDWGAQALPNSTAYPGAVRPILLRKTITGPEVLQFTVPKNIVSRFQGLTVTFGAAVYQRVQGGSNTWNLHIDDSSGSSVSTNGTGASVGGYEFQSVTRTIAQNASSVSFYFNLTGNAGDVFDVCLPTAAFASSMMQSDLTSPWRETIRSVIPWNPPLLTPFTIATPSVELVPGSGLYGWNGIDLEAISLCAVHNSVSNVYASIELTTGTPNAIYFASSRVDAVGESFGPKVSTQVANVMNAAAQTRWPVYHDGTVAIFSNEKNFTPASVTFDFTDIDVTPGTSMN